MKIYLAAVLLLSLAISTPVLLNQEPQPEIVQEADPNEPWTDPANLENEKDDYDIYSYGLIGQEHPELIPTVMVTLKQFPKAMELAQLWNRLYNDRYGVIPVRPGDENDFALKSRKALERFTLTKQIITIMATESMLLKDEFDALYANYDKITMSTDELLDFFDFQDFYNDSIAHLNERDPIILEMGHKLELIIYEFLSRMRGFLFSIDHVRYINNFLIQIIEPFGKKMGAQASIDLTTRVDAGLDMVDTVITIHKEIHSLASGLKAGIILMHDIRKQVVDVVQGLGAASQGYYAPEHVAEFKKKYCKTSGVIEMGVVISVVLSLIF